MSTITITRTVAATLQAAWRAWTDPRELARWLVAAPAGHDL